MAEKQTITKTFEYKLRVNLQFVVACERALDHCRFIYNCSLEHRISHYKQTGKSISLYEQSRQLTEAKREIPELNECLGSIQRDALKRLDEAFKSFFRRLKQPGVKAGFPRFKGKDRYHTFSQQIEPQRKRPLQGDKLTVPGVGTVRVRLSRPIEGKVKQLRITRRASGWYALLVCEIEKPQPLPKTCQEIGVDVGISDFATFSNGEVIPNPHHLALAEKRLKQAQRKLSSKKKGSNNRRKAKRRVALKHEHVAKSRKDFHHKEAKKLVDKFDTIKVEDLNVKGMVKNHALAKAINDVGWGSFFTITKAKAENAGRKFEKVSPRYTSQDCSSCGHRQKMPLAVRVYECGNCHISISRDKNAAINISRAGRAQTSQTVVESDRAHRSNNRLKTTSGRIRTIRPIQSRV
jgi:putative transposase